MQIVFCKTVSRIRNLKEKKWRSIRTLKQTISDNIRGFSDYAIGVIHKRRQQSGLSGWGEAGSVKLDIHGDKMIPIPAMVYFSQRSGCDNCGMGGPTYLKVGDALYKIYVPLTMPIFEKKKSHLKRPVECSKLYLYFLCNVRIT